jgi:hypothetical protein
MLASKPCGTIIGRGEQVGPSGEATQIQDGEKCGLVFL